MTVLTIAHRAGGADAVAPPPPVPVPAVLPAMVLFWISRVLARVVVEEHSASVGGGGVAGDGAVADGGRQRRRRCRRGTCRRPCCWSRRCRETVLFSISRLPPLAK